MKHFLMVVLAILISGPAAGVLLALCDSLFIHSQFWGEEYPFYRLDVGLIYAMFFYLFYFILGLPTTLLTDFMVKRFSLSHKMAIVASFIMYTFVGLLMWKSEEELSIWFILIPVYTYFVMLIVVRNKYDSKKAKVDDDRRKVMTQKAL